MKIRTTILGSVIYALIATVGTAQAEYRIDDGMAETRVGISSGSDPKTLAWLNRFTVQAGRETIIDISIAFGDVPDGSPVTVYLWDDPNQDGDPSDALVLSSAAGVSANSDTNVFNLYDIPDVPLTVGDFFFVGAIMDMTGSQKPGRLDTDGSDDPPATFPPNNHAFLAGATNGSGVDANDLDGAQIPVMLVSSTPIGDGNWLIRASDNGVTPVAQRPTAAEDRVATTLKLAGSATCISDAECQGGFCIDSICYFRYNRYLRINPENAGQRVALRVKHVPTGTTRFVSSPFQYLDNSLTGTMQWAAEAVAGPLFRVWTEAPINVFSCIIVPSNFPGTGEEYQVQAIADGRDPNNESDYSPPLTLHTTRYGDVYEHAPWGGSGYPTPPDDTVNIVDVVGVLSAFTAAPWTARSAYDIEPEVPDRAINITDVVHSLNGFQGLPYTDSFRAPPDCP